MFFWVSNLQLGPGAQVIIPVHEWRGYSIREKMLVPETNKNTF